MPPPIIINDFGNNLTHAEIVYWVRYYNRYKLDLQLTIADFEQQEGLSIVELPNLDGFNREPNYQFYTPEKIIKIRNELFDTETKIEILKSYDANQTHQA